MSATLAVPHLFNACFSPKTEDIRPWQELTPILSYVLQPYAVWGFAFHTALDGRFSRCGIKCGILPKDTLISYLD